MADKMTPAQRSLRGRLGAYVVHSRYDSRELTKPAREAFASSSRSRSACGGQTWPARLISHGLRWRAPRRGRSEVGGLQRGRRRPTRPLVTTMGFGTPRLVRHSHRSLDRLNDPNEGDRGLCGRHRA
jgi:hypothetical protein